MHEVRSQRRGEIFTIVELFHKYFSDPQNRRNCFIVTEKNAGFCRENLRLSFTKQYYNTGIRLRHWKKSGYN